MNFAQENNGPVYEVSVRHGYGLVDVIHYGLATLLGVEPSSLTVHRPEHKHKNRSVLLPETEALISHNTFLANINSPWALGKASGDDSQEAGDDEEGANEL